MSSIELFEQPDVVAAKAKYAELVEELDELRKISKDPDVARWASIAITHTEIASMCAIRALTGGK